MDNTTVSGVWTVTSTPSQLSNATMTSTNETLFVTSSNISQSIVTSPTTYLTYNLTSTVTTLLNVTLVTASTEDTTSEYINVRTQDPAELFHFYATPCIALVGIICNILALAILLGTKLRNSCAGHYLIALAIADSIELLAEFLKWINRLSGIMDGSSALCKLVNHVRYSGQLWSAVLTTTITVERYIIVAWPLHASSLSTATRAKIIILFELMSCLTLGSYGSFFFDIVVFAPGSPGICLLDFSQSEAYSLCNLIISKVLGEVVTSILVIIFTTLIIKNLISSMKFRNAGGELKSDMYSTSAEKQLTFMLVLVASAFILLRIPYTVTWYYSHYRWDVTNVDVVLNQALNVTYVLYLVNHAINFLLFNLSGSNFRSHLVSVLCPCRAQGVRVTSEGNTQTSRATVTRLDVEEDIPMSPRNQQRGVDSNANPKLSTKEQESEQGDQNTEGD